MFDHRAVDFSRMSIDALRTLAEGVGRRSAELGPAFAEPQLEADGAQYWSLEEAREWLSA